MRPLWLFIFAMASVVGLMVLALSFFSWSMADFDCASGYLNCRRMWWNEWGLMTIFLVSTWAAAAFWLYRTRDKN